MDFTKKSVITAVLTEDQDPQWVYFIDGVLFQQKCFKTKEEALKAGNKKLKEKLSRK